VAVDLAVSRAVSCVIVDSTFSSAADMAKRIYPFLPSFLMKTKMDSVSKIKDISVPVLFIHSTEDQTVPFVLGKKLYDAAPGPKEFIEIIGSHTDGHIYDEEKMKNGIRTFLNKQNLI